MLELIYDFRCYSGFFFFNVEMGTCVWWICSSKSNILFVGFFLMSMQCTSLYLIIDFCFIFFFRLGITICFLVPFDGDTFFMLAISCIKSLIVKSVSERQNKKESCFLIPSLGLCLFNGKLTPLILKIIEQCY